MARSFFELELVKWGSSWEGRKMLGKSRKLKVLRMSSPIVEIASGAATYVLHTPRGPQRPYSEKYEKTQICKKHQSNKSGPVYFPMELPISPLKESPGAEMHRARQLFLSVA